MRSNGRGGVHFVAVVVGTPVVARIKKAVDVTGLESTNWVQVILVMGSCICVILEVAVLAV
jgi:hypothetical protein